VTENGDRIAWVGHSTVAIRLDGVLVVTDPVLRKRIFHLRRHADAVSHVLDGLDGILVSHVHYDHLDIRSLVRLGRRVPVVVPRGGGTMLRLRGFADVRELTAGEELELGGLRIRATHAEHAPARRLGAPWAVPSLGFVLDGSHRVYFAGDTDLFEGMAELAPLDVALLPVAGWGPRLPPGHLNPERAAEALRLLRPRVAIPIHWGTFAPVHAPRPDDTPAQAFARAAAEAAPTVAVCILQPGETYPLG
jgi:L-ascorbate metabolism protein UlaG (beta-lactamase superfamily)